MAGAAAICACRFSQTRWALERSSDAGCLLLTLSTPDGFQVCFSLESEALAAMARAAACPESLRPSTPAGLH